MKRVVVTGGAGFIGSNLCKELINRGNKVTAIDNLLTGSQKNIADLLSFDNFKFLEYDVTKTIDSKIIGSVEEIYHLASPADPNKHSPFSYISLPFETMRVNTLGTWNMCELALKKNAKLLFSSTSEIYGDPLISPQHENYRGNVSTFGPRSVYDESKRFGETIVFAYIRTHKLNARVTRIFNTYGPKMNINEGRSVVNFIKQSLNGDNITIYGDGMQTRSFCFIDDQVEGQILAMEKENTSGKIYNIGNPDEKTIIEFAEIIKKLCTSKSKIVFSEDLPEDDPKKRLPDITKAKNELLWKPETTLEEGLIKTIAYFKDNL